jgi:hypothetical protein
MMEALDRARQRDEQRLSPEVTRPVEVRTLADIKRIVSELDPQRNPHSAEIPISAQMEEIVDGHKVVYQASATTRSKSKRDILIDGMQLIKNRQASATEFQNAVEPIEINGKIMKPAVLNANTKGYTWVDPLIRQWTGGVRKETLITWDLGDGYEYRYEVFTHSLTRIPRSQQS